MYYLFIMKIKLSKSQWESIGRQAGWTDEESLAWEQEANLRGFDEDAAYDLERDFGSLEEARRDREERVESPKIKEKSEPKETISEEEEKRQKDLITEKLISELPLYTKSKKDGSIEIDLIPFNRPEGYPYLEDIKKIMDDGVKNNLWDKSVADTFYYKMYRFFMDITY